MVCSIKKDEFFPTSYYLMHIIFVNDLDDDQITFFDKLMQKTMTFLVMESPKDQVVTVVFSVSPELVLRAGRIQ